MKSRITMLTLGVDDLERSVHFYREGLGFQSEGIVGTEFEHGAVAFFDLQARLKLALFPRDHLAIDAGIARSQRSSTEFSIGHNVKSEEAVDAVMRQAVAAGAVIIKPAQKTFWGGYAGYFQDRDGHLREVGRGSNQAALSDGPWVREAADRTLGTRSIQVPSTRPAP